MARSALLRPHQAVRHPPNTSCVWKMARSSNRSDTLRTQHNMTPDARNRISRLSDGRPQLRGSPLAVPNRWDWVSSGAVAAEAASLSLPFRQHCRRLPDDCSDRGDWPLSTTDRRRACKCGGAGTNVLHLDDRGKSRDEASGFYAIILREPSLRAGSAHRIHNEPARVSPGVFGPGRKSLKWSNGRD